MSDTPPAEEEAPVYRGKTLTPESPQPLYIPTPANIPILEHQIDPIFNLMSTHTEQPQQPEALAAANATEEMEMQPTQGAAPSAEQITTNAANISIPQNGTADGQSVNQNDSSLSDTSTQGPAVSSEPTVISTVDEDAAKLISEIAAETASASDRINIDDPAATTASAQTVQPADSQNDSSVAESKDIGQEAMTAMPTEISAAPVLQSVANDDVQALIKSLHVPTAMPADKMSPTTAANEALPLTASGLPPRPPPQEKPSIHPNYEADADIRSFHFPNTSSAAQSSGSTLPASLSMQGANGLPAVQQQGAAPGTAQVHDASILSPASMTAATQVTAGSQSSQDPEAAWRTFQDEESVFTAEGAWEKFPHGSRLFVGNLPTESVTRREIFDIFHKYGKLAQIAIKQAYGFVQFMDVESCQRAMKAEQGARIKERNMHLEVSKPPKNNRGNNQSSAAGDRIRDRHRRERSRSPGSRRNRGSRAGQGAGSGGGGGGGSADLRYSDFRDEPRRARDDYRPGRSPSPRRGDGYRPRDRSSDRHYDGRRRSRSPYGRSGFGRRSPSPRRAGLNDDDLPLPRRAPRDVPDVQIILVEEVSRPFVEYVVAGFQPKGIRCDVLNMPRVSLEAVIRRQIVEGVLAVCNLTRQEERTGKVSLQIFDRSRGSQDVRFDEYDDLTMVIAAELVLRAKAQSSQVASPTFGNGSANPYGNPYMQQQQQPQHHQQQQQQLPPQLAANPNIQSLITSLDPASLQQILSVVQQQQQHQPQQTSPTQPGFPGHDMSALMASMTPQQQQQIQAMQQQQQHQQQQHMQASNIYQYSQSTPQQSVASYGYPTPGAGYPGAGSSGPTPVQGPHGQYGQAGGAANNVQSIMDQLATIQRKG